ncbi:PQQ-dependent sugar dehydrogenase [Nocardioides mangrovicus]|uniref:PQQ-dependent sugar dehydrogenase n=1 Tax=Nocardioides mangrovicus TaxID=2478913 RepID=A0A3L8P7Y7_9ACTN|nr:PQQ-dependent sugar dehydrogenase [Nocardioides mangrovicus]RLV51097.1 PQQ-dependent sugar dehydrogenase [Nocardioides mangrovicus]
MRPLVALLVVAVLAAGCGGGTDSGPFATSSRGAAPVTASPEATTSTGPRVVRTVASGLRVPWGIAFLPDGTAVVTERDTDRVLLVTSGGQVTPVGTVKGDSRGESGLLGVAVSPQFAQDHTVFFYVTTTRDNRIVKARLDGTSLGPTTPVLTKIPAGNIHDGGRLAFGPDGYLYASTGETGDSSLAQDPSSLGGKILRITTTGRPAPGNPDPDSPVWTIGHRNVQGLAFDPDGHLWASEFGDQTWDELNLITRGTNYGWPKAEGRVESGEFRNPKVVWSTDDASPSGLAYLDGHLWLGALHGQRLWRVTVSGTRASDPTDFFVGQYGRLRTVVAAPDGNLWVTTSNRDGRGNPKASDDRILEIAP